MKTIELADASEPLSEYASGADTEPLVITRRGKPVAALVSVEGADLETIQLSQSPKFMRIIDKSRESYRKKGGITTEEMARRLGIKLKPRRRK